MSVRAQAEEHRSPPSNLAAEQALLGALLVNNEAIHLVATFLQPEHLFLPVHGRIYDAVMQMVARWEIANPVTLKTYFENEEALKEAGGGQYLAPLADSAVTVVNAGYYGRAIHDLHLRRPLIHLAEDIWDAGYDAPLEQPPREQVESVESKLYRFLEDASGTRSEMRSISIEQRDFDAICTAAQQLKDMPLHIDDTGGQTPGCIERTVRRLKRPSRLRLLIVDHLQLMRSPHETKAQGRVQQVTDFTMRLKPFAKELDIPMLALSQLNRAGERSDNKVPQLSDLRDSGSIEQDVDIILFLFGKCTIWRRRNHLQPMNTRTDNGRNGTI